MVALLRTWDTAAGILLACYYHNEHKKGPGESKKVHDDALPTLSQLLVGYALTNSFSSSSS